MAIDYGIVPVSLEGFQVVRSKYFVRQAEPIMTLFKSAVSFNVAAYEALNRCESVIIMVNEKEKSFLVKPSASKEGDAIRWVKGKEKPKIARIECTAFAKQIFKMWELNDEYRYRAVGRLVQAEKKIMLLFDFKECEAWDGAKIMKENG